MIRFVLSTKGKISCSLVSLDVVGRDEGRCNGK